MDGLESKRAAIITLYDNLNFGNRLQNYAVQRYLENLGFSYVMSPSLKRLDRNEPVLINLCRRMAHFILEKLPESIEYTKTLRYRRERWNYINSFTNEYIHVDTSLNGQRKMSPELKKQYDYFVVGSDQVWNYWNYYIPNLKYFFLTFADRRQRIAFAPSFGVGEIPKLLRKTYKKGLSGFDRFSVREDRGAELIRELTGNEATVLLDPTMLIDQSEWTKILKKPDLYREDMCEKYILIYCLGPMPKDAKTNIKNLAARMKLDIIDLHNPLNEYYTHTRPDEFLYWIFHAKLIVTNSFHGTAFSVLSRRPFVELDRTDSKTMGSRLDTLLARFGLEERRYRILERYFLSDAPDATEVLFKTDYSHAEETLRLEREKTARFFEKCFSDRAIK